MKLKHYLLIGAGVLLLGLGFWAGWRGHSAWRPCPTITTDTVLVTDPSWHSIKNSMELTIKNLQHKVDSLKAHPHIIQLPGDSILVPADVDTVAIIKDYYTKYAYSLRSENDTIAISDSIVVTQNAPVWNEISYKIKTPFTTVINNIDNSITYSKYLQGGLYVPIYNYKADSARFNSINNVMLELTYVAPKGYLGVGWQPLTNTVGIRVGATILKFRKKK